MRKKGLIQGVGINDSDYATSIHKLIDGKNRLIWICPFYKTWTSMIVRCYSSKYKSVNKTYDDCEVCPDWIYFSKFKSWMVAQHWEGKDLDKDILFVDNKIYGPETCVFVEQRVNKFITDNNAKRGQFMIGADWLKSSNKFRARCSNPLSGDSEFLGLFSSEIEAHNAWLTRKIELAKLLAETIEDTDIGNALISRYENYTNRWDKQ